MNDQLIGVQPSDRRLAKQLKGRSFELYRNLRGALVQIFSRADIEGYFRPAPVVDCQLERDERLGGRVRGYPRLGSVGARGFSRHQTGTILPANGSRENVLGCQ